MQPVETYHHFGLLSVIAVIIGLGFLLWRWPGGRHMTFSQHAAQARSAILFYIGFFTVVLPLLWLFFSGWFAPHFGLSAGFLYCTLAAILFQYSVTLVPEVGGWKTTYHVAGSTLSGLGMLLSLGFLLPADDVNLFGKIVTAFSIAAMAGLLYYGGVNKIKHTHLLILQASFYVTFFVAILSVTYLG